MELNTLITLATLLLLVCLVIALYLHKRQSDRMRVESQKRTEEHESVISLIAKYAAAEGTLPYWAKIQQDLAVALHHPHPEAQPMDIRLDKLMLLIATPEEKAELKVMLQEQIDDPETTSDQVLIAKMFLDSMPLVDKETAAKVLEDPAYKQTPFVIKDSPKKVAEEKEKEKGCEPVDEPRDVG